MIDPIHSLAFSIQANPGVYALLLGSGISRAASIPTGWEVTLNLVRKLARLHKEEADPKPEEWYRTKFGIAPEYSELLEQVAKTPDERQQLLRGYWEPSEVEREEGKKEPTAAHRAIARLAARRYVRVIITTNFDRLTETALTGEGVTPIVVSTEDEIRGMQPLIHTQCCVFKVNGDYLDTRIKNTSAELGKYPPEFDGLLNRIFEEFGLIVCGWSADWDEALRAAMTRAASRRYTMYWIARGDPTDTAQKLIGHRKAVLVKVESADIFFEDLQQHVESIEEFSKPHPLSTEAAIASLKRYMGDSRHRIQLSDLVSNAIEGIMDATSVPDYAVQGGPETNSEEITKRVRRYEAVSSTVLAMAVVGGFLGKRRTSFDMEKRAAAPGLKTIICGRHGLARNATIPSYTVALWVGTGRSGK